MKRSAAFEKRSAAFEAGVAKALADAPLQRALADVPAGFVAGRARQKAAMPEFESLRRTARDIRDHTLAHLDAYLEAFERNAEHAGSRVHWASTAAEAGDIILGICRAAGARTVTKSKSMVSEEIELNARLEAVAIEVVETDLGEYLIQLRGERPSHIIAPAIHLRPDDVANEFRACHVHLPAERDLSTPEAMVAEARGVLREKFLAADVGITGANFLVAATGSAIVVTNEGNADLTMSLPKVHIVLATIDKVVPTFDDAWPLLRLLARSATGQAFTAYTTIVTGPRQPLDDVGPESCHVVILDNGRSELLRSSFRPVLRCIRCGACMNHCPVYCAIGGHAYGSVYPGPIGAVLTPALVGSGEAEHLAQASTFCGRCEEVCPVEIPLVSLMRGWREKDFAAPDERRSRALLRAWTFLARRPRAYRLAARLVAAGLARMAGATGRLARLPFGARWTRQRDFPAPEGRTFQDLWARRQRGGKRPMSRGEIFSAIRIALDASAGASAGAVRRRAAELRLATPGEHARPQIASLTGLPRLTRFKECLAALGADLIEVSAAADAPTAIARYLALHGLPPRLRRGDDALLGGLPWETAPGLIVDRGPAQDGDAVGLSRAVAGVAETGTLALVSGPENPVTLSFLPDTHIVVLREAAILASYEEAIARVLAEHDGALPRTLNLVTGPSRTGDIGGKIVMGAHGPRRLAVVLIGSTL